MLLGQLNGRMEIVLFLKNVGMMYTVQYYLQTCSFATFVNVLKPLKVDQIKFFNAFKSNFD